jgi:hypothetical protein
VGRELAGSVHSPLAKPAGGAGCDQERDAIPAHGQNLVLCSARGHPYQWDEADASADTYETDLAETPDKLIDAMPMGDLLIVYKERSRYALQYVGFPDVIRPQRMPGEVGMLASGCGVQTPMGHVVLAPGDVVIHSGQETRPS